VAAGIESSGVFTIPSVPLAQVPKYCSYGPAGIGSVHVGAHGFPMQTVVSA
jgi:hypothetical protein